MKPKYVLVLILIGLFFFSGCSIIFQSGRRSDMEKIEALERELDALRHTRDILEERLAQEIKDKQVSLKMEEKGLVITFVAEVLFDSGKAVLKEESFPILDKVIRILQEEVPQNNIGIEGHTDNDPIKHSQWESNWELSAQRALSVLHYLEENNVASKRLSAIGYGEYHPVASNDTVEGKGVNRRVEIVILPLSTKSIEKKYLEGKPAKKAVEEEELK